MKRPSLRGAPGAARHRCAQATQGTTLVLDARSDRRDLGPALLQLFSEELRIASFTLNDVVLPARRSPTTRWRCSGDSGGVTLALVFQDVLRRARRPGAFQASTLAPLQAAVPVAAQAVLRPDPVSDRETARVTVPGLSVHARIRRGRLRRDRPRPSEQRDRRRRRLAPRLEGGVTPPSGARGLFVETRRPRPAVIGSGRSPANGGSQISVG